jgi:hypothetical protein
MQCPRCSTDAPPCDCMASIQRHASDAPPLTARHSSQQVRAQTISKVYRTSSGRSGNPNVRINAHTCTPDAMLRTGYLQPAAVQHMAADLPLCHGPAPGSTAARWYKAFVSSRRTMSPTCMLHLQWWITQVLQDGSGGMRPGSGAPHSPHVQPARHTGKHAKGLGCSLDATARLLLDCICRPGQPSGSQQRFHMHHTRSCRVAHSLRTLWT